jgi:NADP-dependent 3-hydroxy acid dehydrogenase YdfG
MSTDESKTAEPSLTNLVAVVTGASSGIGQAIALALARHGASVCAAGRDGGRLRETVSRAGLHSRMVPFQADLGDDRNIEKLRQMLLTDFGRTDILVHCAGVIQHNLMSEARIEDLDLQYVLDLRMPYLLTQALLPQLKATRGQVVFINSSLGLNARRPEAAQYAATQHALKAVADSLREEANPYGVRVLSVYPGRTATPRQQALYEKQGLVYQPEVLMQPEDIAVMVVAALTLPRTAEVTEISMRPMLKSY